MTQLLENQVTFDGAREALSVETRLTQLGFEKRALSEEDRLGSYILRGIDVLMNFRLDTPKYFNFNNQSVSQTKLIFR